MKRIMCARCKQGIEPDKINKITPNTFVCNSCYDKLLQVDIRSTNRNMEERHKVLAALTYVRFKNIDEVLVYISED
jgi:NAD-dependent SIR2 family protein deacetylase